MIQRTPQADNTATATSKSTWLKRLLPLILLVAIGAVILIFDWHRYLSFDALREHRETLSAFVASNALLAGLIYMAVYTLATALSLPGASVMSMSGGFLFGAWLGGFYVIIGATLGATAVFLIAQTALGETLRAKAGPWLSKMSAGFQQDAFNYLLVLRLIPVFPFFIVNLVPALLGVKLNTYVLATAIGILPGVFVFTFAGAGIGSVFDAGEDFSVSAILTPEIITALVGLALLALLPIIYKRWQASKQNSLH